MSRVFISYVHENRELVEKLASELQKYGVATWLDFNEIFPGDRWKEVIRNGIEQGDYFLACFSKEYQAKKETYMNEEINLAIERLRKFRSDRRWFIPAILNESEIPNTPIGGGQTLHDLQWTKLNENWDEGVRKIAKAVGGSLIETEDPPVIYRRDIQLEPQIREDKLKFLCWIYFKSMGSTLKQVQSDDMANVMELDQRRTASIAQFLAQRSLLKFENWYVGLRITHQGIVKAEHDLVEAGISIDRLPPNIVQNISEIRQKRLDFLSCLYEKSKSNSFEPVSRIEVANDTNLDPRERIAEDIVYYLKDESLLLIRGIPNIQITEAGIEKVESEMT